MFVVGAKKAVARWQDSGTNMVFNKSVITKFLEWGYAIVLMVSVFSPGFSQAQGMMSESCPMCGAMGWPGMILGALLILAVIAALIALTIFLIRRSRPSGTH